MEKILKDRLNHLKSRLKEITQPKLTKIINAEEQKGIEIRIDEIEWLLNKIEK